MNLKIKTTFRLLQEREKKTVGQALSLVRLHVKAWSCRASSTQTNTARRVLPFGNETNNQECAVETIRCSPNRCRGSALEITRLSQEPPKWPTCRKRCPGSPKSSSVY